MPQTSPALVLPLDYAAIARILPHRHPFLLVDRVIEFEADRRIAAIKAVSGDEPYLSWQDGDGFLPPTILMEAVAQVGAILVLAKPEYAHSLIFFMGINRARYRRPVRAGDVVRLEAEIVRLRGRMGRLRGAARVEGRVVADGLMSFALGTKDEQV